MENKRYEGLDKSFYEESKPTLLERVCGAKKVIAGVALTAALVGSAAIGLEASCHANDPTQHICPITQLETRLFGIEAGLRHQAKDLEGFGYELKNQEDEKLHEVATSDVQYVEGGYYAPNGGVLSVDEAGNTVVVQTTPAIATEYVAPDGSIQTIFTVPSGYVLEGSIGVKKTAPLYVGPHVDYNLNFLEDGEITETYNESWSYEDGEYVFDRELASSKGISR